ncbi:hypothetical protein C8R47DRAFT_1101603 [Mycena vitilis]|nr:hypothetical protein C8R47DRAFT_1101603 [Mycena vitilis]
MMDGGNTGMCRVLSLGDLAPTTWPTRKGLRRVSGLRCNEGDKDAPSRESAVVSLPRPSALYRHHIGSPKWATTSSSLSCTRWKPSFHFQSPAAFGNMYSSLYPEQLTTSGTDTEFLPKRPLTGRSVDTSGHGPLRSEPARLVSARHWRTSPATIAHPLYGLAWKFWDAVWNMWMNLSRNGNLGCEAATDPNIPQHTPAQNGRGGTRRSHLKTKNSAWGKGRTAKTLRRDAGDRSQHPQPPPLTASSSSAPVVSRRTAGANLLGTDRAGGRGSLEFR